MVKTTPHPYRASVQEYYGKRIHSSADLQTSACCLEGVVPEEHRSILAEIAPEVIDRFYGCGSPIPSVLGEISVLDLGCGSGRDAYLLARLVGEKGKVIGIDMTHEQLVVANGNLDSQMKRWGFKTANLEFRHGYIEDLSSAGIPDASQDLVISNCVINLSPFKESVFSEIFRVLKPGGELLFSDVFSTRRVPPNLATDPVLLGECLAGAMYKEDFRRMLRVNGCLDHRYLNKRKIQLEPSISEKVGMIEFYSATVRAFKLDTLEDICEDYGQVATYQGGITGSPNRFILDDHHVFETGKPALICGNTASMIQETRYSPYFKIQGNRAKHFGAFDCSPVANSIDSPSQAIGSACC
jgi:arsenite methyltransferase